MIVLNPWMLSNELTYSKSMRYIYIHALSIN